VIIAVNGRADVLVTFNTWDFGTVPLHFGVEVLLPAGNYKENQTVKQTTTDPLRLPRSLKEAVKR